ncbi:MAG: hypothetical protein KQH53_08430 [Desulfarculaceae bacterium]|nr:hypothetical protein [Desulfarculaceae bacterium]
MSALPEIPEIILPTPWGAALVLGLVSLLPMPSPTRHRGLIKVMQVPSQRRTDFKRRLNCLIRAAHKQRRKPGHDFSVTLQIAQGHVGWVELIGCQDLQAPGCIYTWEDHYNAGEPTTEPWAWILANPRLAREGEPVPALATPAQQVLFAGV